MNIREKITNEDYNQLSKVGKKVIDNYNNKNIVDLIVWGQVQILNKFIMECETNGLEWKIQNIEGMPFVGLV